MHKIDKTDIHLYQKVAVATVLATLFLVFVGGLVRASGAGLGCPDWPKCFGMWIPPTSATELPPAFETSQFNLLKTWTEYINRLIGVIIGMLIMTTFGLSFRYRKSRPSVFYCSGGALLLVIIQGWLGGRVVMTGLDEWLITLHMLLAMLIIMVLLYAVFKSSDELFSVSLDKKIRRPLFWAASVLLLFTFVQLIVGTQVREMVDVIKDGINPPPREMWLSRIGFLDEFHRTFSWTVFLSGIAVLYFGRWRSDSKLISHLATGIMGIILLQIFLGIGLYYFGMPPAYQVLHLVGVAVLISLNTLLLLILNNDLQLFERFFP